jgi:ssDNA-binding Zn-finger/Zn-ribbon topoisomerase 1
MVELQCPKCRKYFGFSKPRKEHQKGMCPWCGEMIDIGTKRKEPKPLGRPKR